MVDSISGPSIINYAATAVLNRSSKSDSDQTSTSALTTQPSAADDFKAYMKKSPMERMIENWLKAHDLDEEKLKAMKPEEREAIMKQMNKEIADNLKRETAKKGDIVDLTA